MFKRPFIEVRCSEMRVNNSLLINGLMFWGEVKFMFGIGLIVTINFFCHFNNNFVHSLCTYYVTNYLETLYGNGGSICNVIFMYGDMRGRVNELNKALTVCIKIVDKHLLNYPLHKSRLAHSRTPPHYWTNVFTKPQNHSKTLQNLINTSSYKLWQHWIYPSFNDWLVLLSLQLNFTEGYNHWQL